MLALTRRPGQQLVIGDDIFVNIVDVQGENVRIAIEAPRHIKIYRGEIYKAIVEENQQAAVKAEKIDLSDVLRRERP